MGSPFQLLVLFWIRVGGWEPCWGVCRTHAQISHSSAHFIFRSVKSHRYAQALLLHFPYCARPKKIFFFLKQASYYDAQGFLDLAEKNCMLNWGILLSAWSPDRLCFITRDVGACLHLSPPFSCTPNLRQVPWCSPFTQLGWSANSMICRESATAAHPFWFPGQLTGQPHSTELRWNLGFSHYLPLKPAASLRACLWLQLRRFTKAAAASEHLTLRSQSFWIIWGPLCVCKAVGQVVEGEQKTPPCSLEHSKERQKDRGTDAHLCSPMHR